MSVHITQLWKVSAEKFPLHESTATQIRFLLHYAILAPSAHNAQPWSCTIKDDCLWVYYDTSHSLAVSDPTNRQAFLSLGAFVATFVKAAEAFKFACRIDWLPHGEEDITLAAIVSFKKPTTPKLDDQGKSQLQTILDRRIDRSSYQKKIIEKKVIEKLLAINARPELKIDLIEKQEDKDLVGHLVQLSLGFAYSSTTFRQELSHYVISNLSKRNDGIPGHTANYNLVRSLIAPYTIRHFNIGKSEGEKEFKLFSSAPAIVIISSDSDDHISWLKSGYLFQEVGLFLTEHKVAYSINGGPVEAPNSFIKLQKITSPEFRPQLVFRIGYSNTPPDHSPRRDVSAILE